MTNLTLRSPARQAFTSYYTSGPVGGVLRGAGRSQWLPRSSLSSLMLLASPWRPAEGGLTRGLLAHGVVIQSSHPANAHGAGAGAPTAGVGGGGCGRSRPDRLRRAGSQARARVRALRPPLRAGHLSPRRRMAPIAEWEVLRSGRRQGLRPARTADCAGRPSARRQGRERSGGEFAAAEHLLDVLLLQAVGFVKQLDDPLFAEPGELSVGSCLREW